MPPFDPEAFARESESKLRTRTRGPITPSSAPYATDESSGVQPVGARAADLELDGPYDDPSPTMPVPVILVAVPTLAVSRAELARTNLDHRAGFILSHVDGISDVETILDVSAMPSEEALRILAELTARGIIALR